VSVCVCVCVCVCVYVCMFVLHSAAEFLCEQKSADCYILEAAEIM